MADARGEAGRIERCRALIVEDTDEEAARLERYLARYGAERGVAFATRRIASAVEFVAEHPAADLIFMDIDLPGIDGMEAAQELRMHDPDTPLIFVTNLARYAVAGYQVDALDFMVKPVGYGDFALRMDRAMRVVARAASTTMAIPTAEGVRVVRVRDVRWVGLVKHDLAYHVAGYDEPLTVRGSIRAAAQELLPQSFVQVSQGCLANMAHVATIKTDGLEMDDGEMLYFSRSRKKECLAALSRYLGGTI